MPAHRQPAHRQPTHQQPTHQQTRSDNEPPQEPRQHPQDAAKTDVKVKKKNFYLQNWYLPTKRRISEESEILPGVQRIAVRSSFTPLGDALTGRFRRDEEKQEDSDDLDTLGGNTTVVEAEPVADSERYTEIERRIQRRLDEAQERQVEEEVQRRIRAQTKDANEVFGARGRAGDGGNRPVLATPVETEEGSISDSIIASTKLVWLSAADNQMIGSIPDTVAALEQLTEVDYFCNVNKNKVRKGNERRCRKITTSTAGAAAATTTTTTEATTK